MLTPFFFLVIVIYGDGVEYELNRDDQAIFNRTSKADRLRWRMEQVSAAKRRKVDMEIEQDGHYSSDSDDNISIDESHELLSLVSCRIPFNELMNRALIIIFFILFLLGQTCFKSIWRY